MVFRYRSGYLQWDILYDAAVAAHIGRQRSLQVAMVVCTQRRIVVISRYIVLRQIRLELYRRFFIWIVEVFRLHFYARTPNEREREREKERLLIKRRTEKTKLPLFSIKNVYSLQLFCFSIIYLRRARVRRSFIGKYHRIARNKYDLRDVHCIECEN